MTGVAATGSIRPPADSVPGGLASCVETQSAGWARRAGGSFGHAGRMRSIVLAHAAFTLAMVGVMAAVQFVIYPQFRSVDAADFSSYAADHSTRIVAVLALFAPLEVLFAAWLWVDPAAGVDRSLAFVAGALLAIGWVATAAWYAPLHGKLQSEPYDADRIALLIRTNWFRTVLWLARGGFAVWFLWKVIDVD